jgi:F0F1-type ATP synthase membrane subunit b/b'
VAEHVADLEGRIAYLERRLREQEQATPQDQALRNEAYEQTASRIAELVRAFDQDMERMRAEAETEVANRLSEARADAERIDHEAEKVRTEAAAEAERIVREATTEAERVRVEARRTTEETLASLKTRRAALLEDIRRIQDGLQRSAAAVTSILERRGPDAPVE